MAYRNPFIDEKIRVLRKDIEDIQAGSQLLFRLGDGAPQTREAEAAWQQERIGLLEQADAMTRATLKAKVTTLRKQLDEDDEERLHIGPYDDLDEATFRLICNIEMLEVALRSHPRDKRKRG